MERGSAFQDVIECLLKLGIAQTVQGKFKQLQHAIADGLSGQLERLTLAFIAARCV